MSSLSMALMDLTLAGCSPSVGRWTAPRARPLMCRDSLVSYRSGPCGALLCGVWVVCDEWCKNMLNLKLLSQKLIMGLVYPVIMLRTSFSSLRIIFTLCGINPLFCVLWFIMLICFHYIVGSYNSYKLMFTHRSWEHPLNPVDCSFLQLSPPSRTSLTSLMM